MRRTHTHKCMYSPNGCKAVLRCSAPLIDNYDGWPEAYCAAEELGIICEECEDADVCEECGVPVHLTHATGCETAQRKAS